jgi:hypothetical protein
MMRMMLGFWVGVVAVCSGPEREQAKARNNRIMMR